MEVAPIRLATVLTGLGPRAQTLVASNLRQELTIASRALLVAQLETRQF